MLLAASAEGNESEKLVEVLDAPYAQPGDRVYLEGFKEMASLKSAPVDIIDVDTFFSIPIVAKDGYAFVGSQRLCVGSEPLRLKNVLNGEIG